MQVWSRLTSCSDTGKYECDEIARNNMKLNGECTADLQPSREQHMCELVTAESLSGYDVGLWMAVYDKSVYDKSAYE